MPEKVIKFENQCFEKHTARIMETLHQCDKLTEGRADMTTWDKETFALLMEWRSLDSRTKNHLKDGEKIARYKELQANQLEFNELKKELTEKGAI